MNKERLLRLADFLEKEVPKDRFNLESWSTGELDVCGTTACAFGWATKVPEFAEAGLKLVFDQAYPPNHHNPVGYVEFGTFSGFIAAKHFFEIEYDATNYLFYDGQYPKDRCGLEDVVARIREYVATGSR